MTRFEPTLVVERLVVHRENATVYDERFHVGVNILRGENSSGKSTILNLLFYALGGDVSDWSEVALLCSSVSVQVRINGNVATLERDIAQDSRRAMRIFGGSYELALKSPIGEWLQFPYARTVNLESFSQALFRLLGLPEAASENTGNITIHQVLRLLYADQLSPIEHLFKFERFDPPGLRDAIGRLLCGAYDSQLYANELEMRAHQRQADALDGELRAMTSVLSNQEGALTLEWAIQSIRTLIEKREGLDEKIITGERAVYESETQDELTLQQQKEAYDLVRSKQDEIFRLRQEIDGLVLNIADSQRFITALEHKLDGLNDSASVSEHLGLVSFGSCPTCYTVVSPPDANAPPCCPLCKTSFKEGRHADRVVAMINETALQLRQSKKLQELRNASVADLTIKAEVLEQEWNAAAHRLSSLQMLPSSASRTQLRDLQRSAGYLDRQIEGEQKRFKLVEQFVTKTHEKQQIDEKIASLASTNQSIRLRESYRLGVAYAEIADEVRQLLKSDLKRQDAFETANIINFDFAANSIDVDGIKYFSASSRVILKSSFFLGFLAAATKGGSFRHPRFCIIDTIEDKGMEPMRSHNFQNLIAKVSRESKVEHQIIFATAMIATDLDSPEFTVGQHSTRDKPTLNVLPRSGQRLDDSTPPTTGLQGN